MLLQRSFLAIWNRLLAVAPQMARRRFGDLAAQNLMVLSAALLAGCSGQTGVPNKTAEIIGRDAAREAPAPANVPFVDRAQQLGAHFAYSDGATANLSTMRESLGGGLGWFDVDRDGWLDLAVAGGGDFPSERTIAGRPTALFRNLEGKRFVSVGASAGIESTELYTNGIAIADYDNDGFQDLLITGYGRPQLWHNLGDGTFLEVAIAAGIVDDRWGSSAGWADLNGDGSLDVYLAHYVN